MAIRGPLMDPGHPAQKVVIGVQTSGGLAFGALNFGSLQRGRDRTHNTHGDLILQIEYILKPAIEAVRPQMRTGCSIDELTRNAHPVCRLAHAAFEHVAHPEFSPD